MLILALHLSGITLLSALSLALFYDLVFNTRRMVFWEKVIFSLLTISFSSMWVAVIVYFIGIFSSPILEL